MNLKIPYVEVDREGDLPKQCCWCGENPAGPPTETGTHFTPPELVPPGLITADGKVGWRCRCCGGEMRFLFVQTNGQTLAAWRLSETPNWTAIFFPSKPPTIEVAQAIDLHHTRCGGCDEPIPVAKLRSVRHPRGFLLPLLCDDCRGIYAADDKAAV